MISQGELSKIIPVYIFEFIFNIMYVYGSSNFLKSGGLMKHVFAVAVLIMACSMKAQDYTVKPIMIQECAPVPEEIKFGEKPMGYEPGFKIFFMVNGKDMNAFKKDSLSIEYIKTKDGQDISKSRGGKANYKMGSFPKTTEDGKRAFFSLESGENIFGTADDLQIKGQITVLTSSKLETVGTKELEFGKSDSQKAGTFTVTANPKAEVNMLKLGGDDKSLKVKVQGPLDSISNISFSVDGKDEKGNSWFGRDDSRTYSMSNATGKKVVVKINYWLDLKEKTIPFEINLRKQ